MQVVVPEGVVTGQQIQAWFPSGVWGGWFVGGPGRGFLPMGKNEHSESDCARNIPQLETIGKIYLKKKGFAIFHLPMLVYQSVFFVENLKKTGNKR